MSRADVARKLGVDFQIVPRVPNVQDAVDAVRRLFPRFRFDRRKCGRLLEALGAYQRQWDPKGKVFTPKPAHTWASHYADSLACFARGYHPRPDRPTGWRPEPAKGVVTARDFPHLFGRRR